MDLFALGLKIKSDGFAEAMRGLGQLDAKGKQTASSFNGLTRAFVKGGLLERGITAFAKTVVQQLGQSITEAAEAERVMLELKDAVSNVGGNFELLSPAIEGSVKQIESLTRFSDDATRGALAKMILITEDTAGSMKNMGLATDIAARTNKSLEESAALVGKVMTGNTRGLKEFGINTKDADEAMDSLRKKFTGFAEKDGKTFQGRLEQIRNAWGEVLEATGKAITGGNNAAAAMVVIRDKLIDLSKYIDQNGEKWRNWATNVTSSTGKVFSQLNAILDAVNKAGLALYALRTGDTGPIERYKNRGLFSDVSGGKSSTLDPRMGTGGHSKPPPGGGGGTGTTAKDSAVRIPDFGLSGGADLQMQTLADKIDAAVDAIFAPRMEETAESLTQIIGELQKKVLTGPLDQFRAEMGESISSGLANTLGDAIYSGFAAAFNGEGIGGIIGAFTKTVLAGVGGMLTQLGMVYLQYGAVMLGFASLLPNPFTSGPAALAIGSLLVAMGAALGAVASGGGGRGSVSTGGIRGGSRGTTEITRLKFVDRPTSASALVPMQPMVNHFYGPNDPKTQRWAEETLAKAARRKG